MENAQPVAGRLTAYGKEKEISLLPGEIVYISKTYDNIPAPEIPGTFVAPMPEELPVTFGSPNLIQAEWFEGGMTKADEGNLILPFTCEDALSGVRLYIPQCDIFTGAALDGTGLTCRKTMVYDDPYFVCDLPVLSPGQHRIGICKNGIFKEHDRILLEGDLDVDLQSSSQPYKKVLHLYNIKVSIPEQVSITLKKRRSTLLTNRSWALQGQPFYSGEVCYTWGLAAVNGGTYRLKLPRVRDVVTAELDGQVLGTITRPPYAFTFKLDRGVHTLKLRVFNSLGNQMECYAEESGILSGGYIERV